MAKRINHALIVSDKRLKGLAIASRAIGSPALVLVNGGHAALIFTHMTISGEKSFVRSRVDSSRYSLSKTGRKFIPARCLASYCRPA